LKRLTNTSYITIHRERQRDRERQRETEREREREITMARVLDLEAEQLVACVSSKAEVKHQTLIILAASTLI
jgi:hypothetical protein